MDKWIKQHFVETLYKLVTLKPLQVLSTEKNSFLGFTCALKPIKLVTLSSCALNFNFPTLPTIEQNIREDKEQ